MIETLILLPNATDIYIPPIEMESLAVQSD
jgi:hypothetical protein